MSSLRSGSRAARRHSLALCSIANSPCCLYMSPWRLAGGTPRAGSRAAHAARVAGVAANELALLAANLQFRVETVRQTKGVGGAIREYDPSPQLTGRVGPRAVEREAVVEGELEIPPALGVNVASLVLLDGSPLPAQSSSCWQVEPVQPGRTRTVVDHINLSEVATSILPCLVSPCSGVAISIYHTLCALT